jgi:hypothetical protein
VGESPIEHGDTRSETSRWADDLIGTTQSSGFPHFYLTDSNSISKNIAFNRDKKNRFMETDDERRALRKPTKEEPSFKMIPSIKQELERRDY